MDITNSFPKNDNSAKLPEHIVNGWRTCAPLIEAAIRFDVVDVSKTLEHLLALTKEISEEVFKQLGATDQTEFESVRAVILEFIKQAYSNDYVELLKPDVFTDIVVRLLRDASITAEVGIDYSAPIILAQAKLAVSLAATFAKDTSTAVLTTRIRKHTSQILRILKKTSVKLSYSHVDEKMMDSLHYVLIEDAGNIHNAIFITEMNYYEKAKKAGKNLAEYDVDDIVIRKFQQAIAAIVDALLIGGEKNEQ